MPKSRKTKEERIELRVTREDKRLFEKAAHTQGLSLNAYVVARTLHAAKEEAASYQVEKPSRKSQELFSKLNDLYSDSVKLARELALAEKDVAAHRVRPARAFLKEFKRARSISS